MEQVRGSESLRVQNFLTLRDATFEVGRFTVLIGPQASGKSIAAKLLYFCRNFLARQLVQGVEQSFSKRQLIAEGVAAFERMFPPYGWGESPFEISYRCDELALVISRKKVVKMTSKINIELSPHLTAVYSSLRSSYKVRKDELLASPDNSDRIADAGFQALWDTQQQLLKISHVFLPPTFIPASRSFFATLQRTVFSFLASNISIDPLIKEFGSVYENAKSGYTRTARVPRQTPQEASTIAVVRQEIEQILAGQYVKQSDQDWIDAAGRRVNLTNASSGQQESLPMLLVLASQRSANAGRRKLYFVEEPEAHLFPVSQRRLVNIFSSLSAGFGNEFFLTTHSPYILASVNNLMFASGLLDRASQSDVTRITKIIEGASPIRFEDVKAYTVKDGVAVSIVDPETRVIGTSVIDSVSDEFEGVLSQLVSIELGTKG